MDSQGSGVRLTKREVEVLWLIFHGFTSREVGEMLYISARTVEFHLSQAYKKLEVNNKVQAMHEVTRLGLFEPHQAILEELNRQVAGKTAIPLSDPTALLAWAIGP